MYLTGLGDGTNREPRQVQRQALEWFEKHLPSNKQLFVTGPTGIGKSYLLRTLQRHLDGPIVCNNNILAKDYEKIYPELNLLIGKTHYHCNDFSMSCTDKLKKLNTPNYLCPACPLLTSRQRFLNGENSVANPMSLYYFKKLHNFKNNISYVDEAHASLTLIRSITQSKMKLKKSEMKMNLTSELNLIPYLYNQIDESKKAIVRCTSDKTVDKHEAKISKLELLILGLESSPERYSIWLEHETQELMIMPIQVPRNVLKKILGPRSVFISATLFRPDIAELSAGDDYEILHLDSPIPVQNRLINYIPPVDTSLRYGMTDVRKFVKHLENLIEEYGKDKRVLIHATYGLSEQMKDYWKIPVIVHNKETKAAELKSFLASGGVLIGSGMSEGLDLKGELCELNIATKLQFPHAHDPFTRKRSALQDGKEWMLCETLKHLMQALGRGIRSETDKCKLIITDDRFSGFAHQCGKLNLMPEYFSDSIRWCK